MLSYTTRSINFFDTEHKYSSAECMILFQHASTVIVTILSDFCFLEAVQTCESILRAPHIKALDETIVAAGPDIAVVKRLHEVPFIHAT